MQTETGKPSIKEWVKLILLCLVFLYVTDIIVAEKREDRRNREMALFDVIGPVMVGPSSSHTAGAVRIGLMARALLKDEPASGEIFLHGSFATTGKGHGTDRAVVAGILGMEPDDMRIPDSFEIAQKEGFRFQIRCTTLKGAHPNTALIRLQGKDHREIEVQASSVGGGRVMVNRLDGIDVNFSGQNPTLIVHNLDQPGLVAEVSSVLANTSVNIATMHLYRERRGEHAVMVVETDQPVPGETVSRLGETAGIIKVTYFGGI
jgi:L-serine dehydratase